MLWLARSSLRLLKTDQSTYSSKLNCTNIYHVQKCSTLNIYIMYIRFERFALITNVICWNLLYFNSINCMIRITSKLTNNFFINVVTSMNMYEIFVNKKNFIMCDWILTRSRRTHRIFWLIHYNFFLIFRTCRIICNVFLMTLLKNMFVFTLLCRSMTFKTSHMNIKRFKRNENSKNISLTSYDDSIMNMFIKTSFKRINSA